MMMTIMTMNDEWRMETTIIFFVWMKSQTIFSLLFILQKEFCLMNGNISYMFINFILLFPSFFR